MKKCHNQSTLEPADQQIFAANVEICNEQSGQLQMCLMDGDVTALVIVDERAAPVPFYEFESVSEAPPLDTLDIENDESSEISNMTPLSLAEKSSVVEDSIGRNEQSSLTCKVAELGLVSHAASFAIAKIRGAMDDMAESIDPTVLEECQDGTKSMLGKPWLVAFDDFNNHSMGEVSATLLLGESTGNQLQAMTASDGSNSEFEEAGCLMLSDPIPSLKVCVVKDQSIKPATLNEHETVPFALKQPGGVEHTQGVGIIAYGQLGEEIEIALNENGQAIDSRGIEAEVETLPIQILEAMDESENTPSTTEDAVADLEICNRPKKRVFHRLKRMSHFFRAQPSPRCNLDETLRLPAKILSQPAMPVETAKCTTIGTTIHTTRGGGKTVATVFSDESTMYTEETIGKRKESSGQGDSCIGFIRER